MTTLFYNHPSHRNKSVSGRFPDLRLFGLVFIFMFTLTAIVIFLLPRKYESQMKVLVSSQPQDLVITPNEGKSPVGLQDLAINRVNSEIQVMTSRDVLREVVMHSGLDHEPGTVAAAGEPSPRYMDVVVTSLGAHLKVQPIKNSDVISVVYRARDPELAAAVMRNLAQSYLRMHKRARARPGSFEFFNEQTETYAAKLAAAEEALRRFREQHAVDDPTELAILTQKALETEATLDQTTAQAAESGGRIRSALRTVAGLDPRVTSQVHSSPQSALIAQLSDQIATLQNQRTQLLTKFLPGDRLVQEVDSQIEQTQATLNNVRSHPLVDTTTDINQIRQTVQKDLAASEVELTGLEARKKTLSELLGGYRKRLANMAGASTQLEALTRGVQESEQNYLLYAKQREESRIADSLDQQNITDVSLIEAPTYEPRPVFPVIPVDLVIAFLLSLMVAYLSVRLWNMYMAQANDTNEAEITAVSA
jgi:uncharacterized protein involved in exopolysaccharide biosynthesis